MGQGFFINVDDNQWRNYLRAKGGHGPPTFGKKYLPVCILTKKKKFTFGSKIYILPPPPPPKKIYKLKIPKNG